LPLTTRLRSVLRNLFRSREVERDLREELQSHLQLLTDQNLRDGMSPEEAQRAARIELGGTEQVKEKVRQQRVGNWLQSIFSDCRFALRQLRKSPAVTATVVLTLALGIGVNTAMFSLLNGWLLRPLPLSAPEQITVLASEQKEGSNGNFSYLDFLDFQKQSDDFSDLFAYAVGIGGLSAGGEATEIAYSSVTGNYFSSLGIKPVIGRLFLPGEGQKPNDELLIVLGYSFWQKRFAGDPGVVGKAVTVNGKPATVVGVVPREFRGTVFVLEMDVYLPLSAMSLSDNSQGFWNTRDDRRLAVMGRLKHATNI
jgi:hypothetical protein